MASRRTRARKTRPAETGTGVAGALTALVCYALGIDDPGVYAALLVVVAALPTAITRAVEFWISREPR